MKIKVVCVTIFSMEMKIISFEKNNEVKNTAEVFPIVSINPKVTFESKNTPRYESDVVDVKTNEKVGCVEFKLSHLSKTLMIERVVIDKPKQGYGVSLYKTIQSTYPEYQLQSSGNQMNHKSDTSQEKPDAVYLWEKLVKLGEAEGDEKVGFRMKKIF